MSTIEAVIFDMDGVLVDAKDWHYEALNKALQHFGFEISRYDHVVTFDGLPTRKKLEMLTRERGLPTGLHRLIGDLKQIYTMHLIYEKCRPTFAHEYALSRLKSRGLKLGLASNSVSATVRTMMKQTMLETYLDFMLSNEDVSRAKPDPEIYLLAATKAGVPPERCLVVEDNEIGVAAARAAGAQVMIVRGVSEVTLENIDRHLGRHASGVVR